jgi:pimeloyl-ACP methyl ester carboxylesterase
MSPEAVALRPGAAVERLGPPGGAMMFWPGPAEATPVLLLHGAACGAWVWAEGFAARLARGRACAALDFPRRPGASLADYAAAVRAALDVLGRPVLLVGHSLGALVAQRLLGDRRVAGAALLAPVPPEGLWGANARLALRDPGLWTACMRMTDAPGGAPDGFARALFGAAMPREASRRHLRRLGGESLAVLWEAQLPQPVWPAWLLGKPALILAAAEDELVPLDMARRCAAWHGAPCEVRDGAGHLMMLDPGWAGVAERVARWADQRG